MEVLKIEGGKRLKGETTVKGAKNAALPILAAAALGKRCVIHNCPKLKDTEVAMKILNELGVNTEFFDNTVITEGRDELACSKIEDALMKEMRSSVIFLGVLLSRCKAAEISYPGGCSIGKRPIDLHLKAFKELGVEVKEEKDRIYCFSDKIKSGKVRLEFPSVGATENIMILAAVSDAVVEIENVAKEPEILDLQSFINSMGGNIRGASSGKIVIEGVKALKNTEYTIMPDRIETLTYMAGIAACGGEGKLWGARYDHIKFPSEILRRAGSEIEGGENFVKIISPKRPKSFNAVHTNPYPDFPTDAQAIFMAAAAKSKGKSCFTENIFENRFHHIPQLEKLGADIKIFQNSAYVTGKRQLHGARMTALDLRGGAAIVIGALAAKGSSVIENIGYIDRGYENIERSFGDFGAEITREKLWTKEVLKEIKSQ